MINRAIITQAELIDTQMTDDYSIPRMLVDKGFKKESGHIQPKLVGLIGYTIDFETGDRHYFQDIRG